MQKRLKMVAAVTAVVMAGAGVVAATTTRTGARTVRYVDRRLGLTASGRQAAFDGLLARGRTEFEAVLQADRSRWRDVEYPSKAGLLAHRALALEAVRTRLLEQRSDPFAIDLLFALGGDEARQILRDVAQRSTDYYAGTFPEAMRALLQPAELKQLALTLPDRTRSDAVIALGNNADRPFLEALIALPGGLRTILMLSVPGAREAAMAAYPTLNRADKLTLIQALTWPVPPGQPQPPAPDYKRLLASETDPAVRQVLLYRTGDLPGLLASFEKDGAFPDNSLWNARVEAQLAAEYPDSFLARGIKAYEAIRGQPYFEWEKVSAHGYSRLWEYGNRYYEPDREIPLWLEYLKTYGKHEAASDAAYRLGRSYEITGDYANALHWLYSATTLGGGNMAEAARERVVWVLDVLMSESNLSALPPQLDPELRRMAAYTLAVRELRAHRYDEAVTGFDRVLADAAGAGAAGDPLPGMWDSFVDRVRVQRDQAARLRDLAARDTPESRYAIAAAMYHDELLFYNHLWGGSRSGYYGSMQMEGAMQGDLSAAARTWEAESNHLLQAARSFEALRDAPAPIAEKAAYSRALALIQLLDFGKDLSLHKPPTEAADDAVAAMTRFVRDFPNSSLAPDGLLSLGYLTRDASYFARILKEFPDSTAATDAKQAQLPEFYHPELYPLPFEYLKLETAPPAVADWAQGTTTPAAKTIGEYTYFLFRSADPHKWGDLSVADSIRGPIMVHVNWSDDARGTGYVLARIPATSRTVAFR